MEPANIRIDIMINDDSKYISNIGEVAMNWPIIKGKVSHPIEAATTMIPPILPVILMFDFIQSRPVANEGAMPMPIPTVAILSSRTD